MPNACLLLIFGVQRRIAPRERLQHRSGLAIEFLPVVVHVFELDARTAFVESERFERRNKASGRTVSVNQVMAIPDQGRVLAR
jgi:hypothetical protein